MDYSTASGRGCLYPPGDGFAEELAACEARHPTSLAVCNVVFSLLFLDHAGLLSTTGTESWLFASRLRDLTSLPGIFDSQHISGKSTPGSIPDERLASDKSRQCLKWKGQGHCVIRLPFMSPTASNEIRSTWTMPHAAPSELEDSNLEHDRSRAIKAPIGFLKRSDIFEREEPYAFRYQADNLPERRTNMETEYMDVEICDIRGQEQRASLDTCGFQVRKLQSSMTYEQFNNPAAVEDVYLRDLRQLLLEEFGAAVVYFERTRVRDICAPCLEALWPLTLFQIRRRHPDFPKSTGMVYDHHQPSTAAHVGA